MHAPQSSSGTSSREPLRQNFADAVEYVEKPVVVVAVVVDVGQQQRLGPVAAAALRQSSERTMQRLQIDDLLELDDSKAEPY